MTLKKNDIRLTFIKKEKKLKKLKSLTGIFFSFSLYCDFHFVTLPTKIKQTYKIKIHL